VDVHRSARRHGVSDESIHHAIEHRLVTRALDEDPPRTLVIGPDLAGNLIELVVVEFEDVQLVIHAMPLRRKYHSLLPEADADE
jgi:hypothetical protein